MGEFLPAREQLEMAISIYDPERHPPLAFRAADGAAVRPFWRSFAFTARRGDLSSGKYRKSRNAEFAHGRRDYLAEIKFPNYGAPFRVIHPFLVTPSGP